MVVASLTTLPNVLQAPSTIVDVADVPPTTLTTVDTRLAPTPLHFVSGHLSDSVVRVTGEESRRDANPALRLLL